VGLGTLLKTACWEVSFYQVSSYQVLRRNNVGVVYFRVNGKLIYLAANNISELRKLLRSKETHPAIGQDFVE
jgi:hypothetical protein